MKTIKTIMLLAVLLIASFAANAQTTTTANTELTPMEKYFVGKWRLNVYGLPQGDAVMILTIEKKDGVLGGNIGNEGVAGSLKLTKTEIKDKTLTVRFLGGGWDVPLSIDMKDDTSVTGSMNDMFDIDGKKMIEENKQ